MFVNVIEKFREPIQMCVLPYTYVEHGSQLSKSAVLPKSDAWDP
jgi:hypothetical protein